MDETPQTELREAQLHSLMSGFLTLYWWRVLLHSWRFTSGLLDGLEVNICGRKTIFLCAQRRDKAGLTRTFLRKSFLWVTQSRHLKASELTRRNSWWLVTMAACIPSLWSNQRVGVTEGMEGGRRSREGRLLRNARPALSGFVGISSTILFPIPSFIIFSDFLFHRGQSSLHRAEESLKAKLNSNHLKVDNEPRGWDKTKKY